MIEAQPLLSQSAAEVIARCRELARISDVPGETTRTYLSEATKGAHALLTSWMLRAGLDVRIDDIGNLRGLRRATGSAAQSAQTAQTPTLLLFSHLDTVPNAGAFDGPLGVMLALAAIEELGARPLPFHIELLALAEEEGVRFALAFLSSKALVGELTPEMLATPDAEGITVTQAARNYGLDPSRIHTTCTLPQPVIAAIECHIEQGPVLEAADAPTAVVESIIGQTRLAFTFTGHANHAGTTPMPLRADALAAAAQWITEVERFALDYTQLIATVGKLDVLPNAGNVVPGEVRATLDVRHPSDESRHAAVAHLLNKAQAAGEAHGVHVHAETRLQQRSVPMNAALTTQLAEAAERAGQVPRRMFSGAGHDAMILAPHVPTAMLFVRSPGGVSHHPDESVRTEDVAAALATLLEFITHLEV
jgi:allantoate deiminase